MPAQIPKRIIQTGKYSQLALKDRAMASNVRLWNPEFEYRYFDNAAVDAFVAAEFPQYRSIFDGFRYRIQKYDFFRYLAVYRYGGFYFDLDVLLATGLSPLLDAGCVFPFEGLTFSRFLRNEYGLDWQIGNYAFGGAPGHPFLEAVIDNCVRAQRDPRWLEPMMKSLPPLSRVDFLILNSTGPGLLSRTLAEAPELTADMTVLFPEDVCDTSTWNRFGDMGIHLMDGSWRNPGGLVRRRLTQIWEVRRMNRLLKESRNSGKTRRHAGRSLLPGSSAAGALP